MKIYIRLIYLPIFFVLISCLGEELQNTNINPDKVNNDISLNNLESYCTNYKSENINWNYLKDIDFSQLPKTLQKRYIMLNDSEVIDINNEQIRYKKFVSTVDNYDSRYLSYAIPELAYLMSENTRKEFVTRLKDFYPYRSSKTGDLPFSKIEQIINYFPVYDYKKPMKFIDSFNHPCAALAISWLARDMLWASKNQEYKKATDDYNNLKNDPQNKAYIHNLPYLATAMARAKENLDNIDNVLLNLQGQSLNDLSWKSITNAVYGAPKDSMLNTGSFNGFLVRGDLLN